MVRAEPVFADDSNFALAEFSNPFQYLLLKAGDFVGQARSENGMYVISGQTTYRFSDVFTDPSKIRDFIAWIREQPDRARRIAQKLGATVGIGNEPSGAALDFSAADFNDWFIALTEFGGTAYPISGTWRSAFEAKVFVDPGLSKF